jgi:hypothetical protein
MNKNTLSVGSQVIREGKYIYQDRADNLISAEYAYKYPVIVVKAWKEMLRRANVGFKKEVDSGEFTITKLSATVKVTEFRYLDDLGNKTIEPPKWETVSIEQIKREAKAACKKEVITERFNPSAIAMTNLEQLIQESIDYPSLLHCLSGIMEDRPHHNTVTDLILDAIDQPYLGENLPTIGGIANLVTAGRRVEDIPGLDNSEKDPVQAKKRLTDRIVDILTRLGTPYSKAPKGRPKGLPPAEERNLALRNALYLWWLDNRQGKSNADLAVLHRKDLMLYLNEQNYPSTYDKQLKKDAIKWAKWWRHSLLGIHIHLDFS